MKSEAETVGELASLKSTNSNNLSKSRLAAIARCEAVVYNIPASKLQAKPASTVHMKCMDNLKFMRSLLSEAMQLIVTSPPYNIGKAYEYRSSLDVYVDAQAQVIEECVRLLAPTGSICWQVGNHVSNGEIFPLDLVLYPLFKKHGLRLRNRIVWHFEHGLHCTKRMSGRYETILWLTKGDDYFFDVDPIRVPSKYPGKKHFKGPKTVNFREILLARIRETSGYSLTSSPTTSKRPCIHVNFQSNWSNGLYYRSLAPVMLFSIPIWG